MIGYNKLTHCFFYGWTNMLVKHQMSVSKKRKLYVIKRFRYIFFFLFRIIWNIHLSEYFCHLELKIRILELVLPWWVVEAPNSSIAALILGCCLNMGCKIIVGRVDANILEIFWKVNAVKNLQSYEPKVWLTHIAKYFKISILEEPILKTTATAKILKFYQKCQVRYTFETLYCLHYIENIFARLI